ncbi:aminotransferase class I/II-fold pyridoxal phosphate-dependent enzyme [Streptomyces prunicolor]|uniref:aminotransferase class I/II-fold pyridoxal phosphate-dependent enzyme n=1 Tax=Streptomyces prunicolor TaxID=67348 RepID=UPI00386C08A6|nr:aminotransferase class I/II-fold pyridoxal phosphate-dependent enzyme [Streptomyces prunicolor]
MYLRALEILDPTTEGSVYRPSEADAVITRGATEALDLVLRALFEPGKDAVAVTWPSFGFFERLATLHNVAQYRVALGGARYDRLDIDRLLSLPVKGIFLCDPNNPTSTCLDADDLDCLLDRFDGVVIIDETYSEFSARPSHRHKLDAHPNLISVRSMSKALGMANLRLGALFGGPASLDAVRKVRPPFPIPSLVTGAATAELSQPAQLASRIASCVAERDRLAKNLTDCPEVLDVFADAGFISIRIADQDSVTAKLQDAHIAVTLEPEGWRNHLRISVGSPSENARLLSALQRNAQRNTP